jgi:type III pantothenate kinase
MLLVIDVGNSNIVLGIYDGPQLIRNWRLSTDKSRTSDEYAVLLHSLFGQAGLGFTSITPPSSPRSFPR